MGDMGACRLVCEAMQRWHGDPDLQKRGHHAIRSLAAQGAGAYGNVSLSAAGCDSRVVIEGMGWTRNNRGVGKDGAVTLKGFRTRLSCMRLCALRQALQEYNGLRMIGDNLALHPLDLELTGAGLCAITELARASASDREGERDRTGFLSAAHQCALVLTSVLKPDCHPPPHLPPSALTAAAALAALDPSVALALVDDNVHVTIVRFMSTPEALNQLYPQVWQQP
jgi:hypothetical protein